MFYYDPQIRQLTEAKNCNFEVVLVELLLHTWS